MSAYYGTLSSDKGETTRAGHKWIQATAQSYAGSVSVEIHGDEVIIRASRGSQASPNKTLFEGSLPDLVKADKLIREGGPNMK